MEIINQEFGREIQTLPSGIFSLDSKWEDINRVNFFGEPNEAYTKVSVVHFTSLEKLWSYSTNRVSRIRPNAHPIFYELWETWRRTRMEICRSFFVKDYLARCVWRIADFGRTDDGVQSSTATLANGLPDRVRGPTGNGG